MAHLAVFSYFYIQIEVKDYMSQKLLHNFDLNYILSVFFSNYYIKNVNI